MPREPLTFWLPLDNFTAARVTVEVVEAPAGGLDFERTREPLVPELDAIAKALTDRKWTFHKPI
jgi:hypothetical protein